MIDGINDRRPQIVVIDGRCEMIIGGMIDGWYMVQWIVDE